MQNGGAFTEEPSRYLTFYSISSGETLKQYADRMTLDNPAYDKTPAERQSIEINGLNAEKYAAIGVHLEGYFIVFSNNRTIVEFNIPTAYPSPDDTLNQILSTFTFDPLDTRNFIGQNQEIDKDSKTSPDGAYIVSEAWASAGDAPPKITVKDRQGKVIFADIVAINSDKVVDKMKEYYNGGEGQFNWRLGHWKNNITLGVSFNLATDDTILADLDVTTGNLIDSSFKLIKQNGTE
jgi:hypothetical protein